MRNGSTIEWIRPCLATDRVCSTNSMSVKKLKLMCESKMEGFVFTFSRTSSSGLSTIFILVSLAPRLSSAAEEWDDSDDTDSVYGAGE
jgi:hypothetical protein